MVVNQKERIYVIRTGSLCNNHCLMCYLQAYNKTTKDIKNNIKEARFKGYDTLKFVGGEPTARKDILELISYANKIGFKNIKILSNGRRFSDNKFCNQIKKCGLTEIEISLHGHRDRIHSTITNRKNSFGEVLKGVENLRAIDSIKTEKVNTVVSSYNYKMLGEMLDFIDKLGFKTWVIMDLVPQGRGFKNYRLLSVEPSKLAKTFLDLGKKCIKLKNLKMIIFDDFSFCFLPEGIKRFKNIYLCNAIGMLSCYDYDQIKKRFSFKNEEYVDKNKSKIAICEACLLKNQCTGIWNGYLELYGEEEINSLAREFGCLR